VNIAVALSAGSGDGRRRLLTGSRSEGPAGRRKPGGGVLHRVPGRHPHHHGSGLTTSGTQSCSWRCCWLRGQRFRGCICILITVGGAGARLCGPSSMS